MSYLTTLLFGLSFPVFEQNRRENVRLLVALLFLLAAGDALSQQPPNRLPFEHLTVADGLPENSVTVMLQDRLGFMWLGTQNGLVRYDGTKMTYFRHNPADKYSLKGRQIRALYEDKNGDMWVGCESLFRFERATQRFIEYPAKARKKQPFRTGFTLFMKTNRGISGP